MLKSCSLCGCDRPHQSVERSGIPVFQNVVYPTRDAAITAPRAAFKLGTCRNCGFSYNAVFDAKLVDYDEHYDNYVASDQFRRYYVDVATMLIEKLNLREGLVYDVGCGKGEFLRVMCELAPGIKGVGLDPSCTPVTEGNFELRRQTFEQSNVEDGAKLVILRHVLEHIADPRVFLDGLRAAMPDAPLYIEVPDLDWILENRTFWDFCYEHCNYFTPETLAYAMRVSSFEILAQEAAFGGQYQWALGMPASRVSSPAPDPANATRQIDLYRAEEDAQIDRLRTQADRQHGFSIWGMATKGVLLASLLGETRILGGIDTNQNKQDKFAAGSGVKIHAPEWLATLPPRSKVLVMNPNYFAEIVAMAAAIRNDIDVQAI